MSIRAMAWAFDQNLPCAHKFVLVVLCDFADKEGKCWPSQATIAAHCGLSRQHVNRCLADLARDGWVEVEHRTRHNGSKAASSYQIQMSTELTTTRARDVNDDDMGMSTQMTSLTTKLEPLGKKADANASAKESGSSDDGIEQVSSGGHPRERGTRLPAEWWPGPDERQFALDCGLDPDRVAGEFRDYWHSLPGSKGEKLDWAATFRNRCRGLEARPRPRPARSGDDRPRTSKLLAAVSRISTEGVRARNHR